ncbi:hypothetical protein BD777DRAFT_124624 [Yarrowia lipolytica]|nr:hypothetical protein BD777DRAFT_124624 [Yarrowia lipolytica]
MIKLDTNHQYNHSIAFIVHHHHDTHMTPFATPLEAVCNSPKIGTTRDNSHQLASRRPRDDGKSKPKTRLRNQV